MKTMVSFLLNVVLLATSCCNAAPHSLRVARDTSGSVALVPITIPNLVNLGVNVGDLSKIDPRADANAFGSVFISVPGLIQLGIDINGLASIGTNAAGLAQLGVSSNDLQLLGATNDIISNVFDSTGNIINGVEATINGVVLTVVNGVVTNLISAIVGGVVSGVVSGVVCGVVDGVLGGIGGGSNLLGVLGK